MRDREPRQAPETHPVIDYIRKVSDRWNMVLIHCGFLIGDKTFRSLPRDDRKKQL